MSEPFSTNELLLRSDRIAFGKIPPEVAYPTEKILILPDQTGSKILIGFSTIVSTNTSLGTLQAIYPQNAPFTFDLQQSSFGINISSPQYTLDIQTTTGIRVSGGTIIANASGIFSVPTAALFSTLPSYVFGPGTIPTSALASTSGIIAGISVPTSALFSTLPTALYAPSSIPLVALQSSGMLIASSFMGDGYYLSNIPLANINGDITGNFFKPNTIPLSSLASTGQIWIRDTTGSIFAPLMSTATLATSSLTANFFSTIEIQAQDIRTSTIVASNFTANIFNAQNISALRVQASSLTVEQRITGGYFLGDGGGLVNLNPAALNTTIPPSKFGYQTIAFTALSPYGTFQVINGNIDFQKNTTTNIQGFLYVSSIYGDGSQLYNLNILSSPSFNSTFAGLGQIYVSTPSLFSTVRGLGSANYVSSTQLNSTVAGLATANYVSSTQLNSTVAGLGSANYISSTQLYSTIEGLASINYISTSQLNSTVAGLANANYVSTTQLNSTVQGLGSANYISSTQLYSTVEGLGSANYISSAQLLSTTFGLEKYISSFIDPQELASSILPFISTNYFQTQLQSTVGGLGQTYVSTTSLISTTLFFQTAGFLSSPNLLSTVEGLGSAQYVSTASLVSTVGGLAASGIIYKPDLNSTVAGLGQNYVSTVSLFSTVEGLGSASYVSSLSLVSTTIFFQTAGFLSSPNLLSTVEGLGSANYVSTASLVSTVGGLAASGIIYKPDLNSTVGGLGQIYVSTASLVSTVGGLAASGIVYNSNLTSTVQGLGQIYPSTLSMMSSIDTSISSFSTALGYLSGEVTRISLVSTVQGLGSSDYISSAQLISTTGGLEKYISSFIDPAELASSVVQFISSTYFTSQLTSTVYGLQTTPYFSTGQGTFSSLYINLTPETAPFWYEHNDVPGNDPQPKPLALDIFGSARVIKNLYIGSTTSILGKGQITAPYMAVANWICTSQTLTSNVIFFSDTPGFFDKAMGYKGGNLVFGNGGYPDIYNADLITTSSFVNTTITSSIQGLGAYGYISSLSNVGMVSTQQLFASSIQVPYISSLSIWVSSINGAAPGTGSLTSIPSSLSSFAFYTSSLFASTIITPIMSTQQLFASSIQAPYISSAALWVSTVNGVVPGVFNGSTTSLSSASIFTSTLNANTINVSTLNLYSTLNMNYNAISNTGSVYFAKNVIPNAGNSSAGGTYSTYSSGGTTYALHAYTTVGTASFAPSGTITGAQILIVAGGGGGGAWVGGGGGAGGLIYLTGQTITPGTYTIVVGSGGTGAVSGGSGGTNGNNSSGFGQTAIGGGRGGSYFSIAAGNGGSGGGGTYSASAGTGTAGQGYNGGTNTSGSGSGGGGAGGAGQNAANDPGAAGNGGIGVQVSITGTALYYAGGGGGATNQTSPASGLGGQGGGGNGANGPDPTNGGNATFYGGGGGGGTRAGSQGGTGYQGVVYISYPVATQPVGTSFGTVDADSLLNMTITPASANVRIRGPTEWRYITTVTPNTTIDLTSQVSYFATTYRLTTSGSINITFPSVTNGAWWTFTNASSNLQYLLPGGSGQSSGLASSYLLAPGASMTIYADSTVYYADFTGRTLFGTSSTATALQFYGLNGTYNNTVLAEISTGGGTQELLLFKGSTATDRIRMQTTGNFVVETGVSSRTWSNTTTTLSNATPAFIINTSSNVGIQTASPGATLDVAGTARAITLSTQQLLASTVQAPIISSQQLFARTEISISSLTSTLIVNGGGIFRFNGTNSASAYGLGSDTLTLLTSSNANQSGIASLAFGVSNSGYPLGRIYALDTALSGSPVSQIIFQNVPVSATSFNSNYSYTGSGQTFTVPTGVTTMQVTLWGAGGGGSSAVTAAAGAGAFVQGTLSVSPGQVYTIVVGQGGASATTSPMYGGGGFAPLGGCGGGRSAIQLNLAVSITSATGSSGTVTYTTSGTHGLLINQPVIISGLSPSGFNGNFVVVSTPALNQFVVSSSQTGSSSGTGSILGEIVNVGGGAGGGGGGVGGMATFSGTAASGSSGGGGTQTSGGTSVGTAGTLFQGGNGGFSTRGSGGGGGYYGGGGGSGNGYGGDNGGGGGSSYTSHTSFALTQGLNSPNSQNQAPGTSVAGYVSGVAAGATTAGASGGNGLVLIASIGGSITEAMRIGSNGYLGIGTTTPATTLDVAGTGRFITLSTQALWVSSINGAAPGTGSLTSLPSTISTFSLLTSSITASTIQTQIISALTLNVSSITGVSLGGVQAAQLTSTTIGLGTLGYASSIVLASFSFYTVSSGTSYTAAPYGQQLMTLSNLSYQFSPVTLSNDGITLNVSTNAVQTYRISYMTGVNQNTFMTPRPTITMAVSTPSNVVYYPSVESIDAGGGSVSFLERLDSNSQLLFYMNGLSNYTFQDTDTSLYRMSFEQIQGSVGAIYSTTYVATSFNEFTSSCIFYENATFKKSTIASNAYVSLNLNVAGDAIFQQSTITNSAYTNYLRVMCNAVIGPGSITMQDNNINASNVQTSTLSILDQSTMTYRPFFISSGAIYYGSNVASAGGSNLVATGGSTLSSLFVGSSSNQNFIKFWGSIGEYNNTVIAQQSTGAGSSELLFFEGSTINDQFRFQTTGGIRFETGVSAPRNFCNANQLATPSMIINSSSNVGILTNNPTFNLDVGGNARFQTLMSSPTATVGALFVGISFV